MCVLPPPIDTQHTQGPCRFVILEHRKLFSHEPRDIDNDIHREYQNERLYTTGNPFGGRELLEISIGRFWGPEGVNIPAAYAQGNAITCSVYSCKWRPGCFLDHGGGNLGSIKLASLHTKVASLHLPSVVNRCRLHIIFFIFCFRVLSERSGRRMPPAERSAL